MDAKVPWTLEYHLEHWFHALLLPEFWPQRCPEGEDVTWRFLSLLGRYGVNAHFFILGHVAEFSPKLVETIERLGHPIGSHGYWHRHGEREGDVSDQIARTHLPAACQGYRSPFWDTTPRPGWSGGSYFRFLPLSWLRAELLRSGTLWLHPHDLYPQSTGPLRRRCGTKAAWNKLDTLLDERR